MKKTYKRSMGKRAVSMSLAIALAMGTIPGGFSWVEPTIVKAADSTITVNENEKVTTECIKDSKLLEYLKSLINASLGRSSSEDITMRELLNYSGDIDLTSIGSQITTIEGLGYARSAKNINLSTVTQINKIIKNEFDGCKGLTTITLPGTIVEIQAYAFRGCENLTTINLPEGLHTIGEAAFSSCSRLNNITLPAGIETIQDDAFKACTSLRKIAFPNGTMRLGSGIFEGCTALGEVEFAEDTEKNFTSIPAACFKSTAIQDVKLPVTITNIEAGAFQLTTGLRDFDLSHCVNLEKISQYAFAGSSVRTIQLPEQLKVIETLAFNASYLTSISLPEQISEIAKGTFVSCTNLKEVSIPKGVKTIKEEAFKQCYSLNNIVIRDAKDSILETIEKNTFIYCYDLKSTAFLKELTNLKIIDDYAFKFIDPSTVIVSSTPILTLADVLGMTKTKNIYGEEYFAYGLEEVVLPDCLEKLGKEVFIENPILMTVTFGKQLESIPDNTFKNCYKLEKLVLPENVLSIGASAFSSCYRLNDTVFPEKLKEIGASAFENCGRRAVYGDEVYYHRRYVKSDKKYETKPASSLETMEEQIIFVEDEKGNQFFKSVFVDETDLKSQLTSEELTSGEYETLYILARKKYIAPDKVSKIKQSELTDYRSYTLSNDNTEILSCEHIYVDESSGDNVLHNNENDGDIAVYIRGGGSGGLKPQNAYAYTGMQHITLPDSLTTIGNSAFKNNYNLISVTLPKYIKEIPDSMLEIQDGTKLQKYNWITKEDYQYQYVGLQSVRMPDGLEVIGNSAFKNCYRFNLDNGQLPSSLIEIKNSAFESCRSLTSVKFPSKLTSIGEKGFYQCGDYYYVYNSRGELVKDEELLRPDYGLKTISFDTATSLEKIGEYGFYQTPVTSVTLPEKVTALQAYLFKNCSYLQNIVCSDSTTMLRAQVFSGCDSLASIHIPATTTVSKNVFYGGVNRDVSFTIKKTPELSVGLGHEMDLPLYLFIDGQINDGKITVETADGGDNIISYTYDANNIERINEWDIRKIKVKGEKLGQRTITVSASLAYPVSETGNVIISPKASFTINVVEKKCEKIEDSVINRIVSVKDTNGFVLSPIITPIDTTQAKEWSNDNDEVASLLPLTEKVDDKDVVTGEAKVIPKGLGTSKVSLKIGEQVIHYFIQVVVPASKVVLKEEDQKLSFYIDENLTKTLQPELQYNTSSFTEEQMKEYGDQIVFESSNTEVATVDKNGVVRPVGEGTATITITAQAGKVKATSNVTVYGTVTKVTLTDEQGQTLTNKTKTINVKDTFTLCFKTNPENSIVPIQYEFVDETESGSIVWVKTNTAMITTEQGEQKNKTVSYEFKADKLGTSTIVIKPEGRSDVSSLQDSVTVRVVANAKSVRLNEYANLYIGDKKEIFKSLTSELGTVEKIDKINTITTDTVKFESSNSDVIKVDKTTGNIEALSKGTATIKVTVTAVDGSTITESVTLTVKAPLASDLDFEAINEKRTLKVNETLQLKYQFVPNNAEDSITFTSENETVATVDKNTGLVTGKKAGTAVIKAVTEGKQIIKKITITVTNPITKITMNQTTRTLNVGGAVKLTYSITPQDATDTLTWSSGNTSIATVDKEGNVKAVGVGTTTITVKTQNGLQATCKVTVQKNQTTPPNLAKSVIIKTKSASTSTIYVVGGKKYKLAAQKNPTNASDKLTWSSSNVKVAMVNKNNGTVTAKKAGTAVITVKTSSGKTKKITVKVVKKAKKAKKVTVTKNRVMKKGNSLRLKVTTTAKSTDTLTWRSSKKSVAKVDAYGYITALRPGKTVITVRTSSGRTAKCNITVK